MLLDRMTHPGANNGMQARLLVGCGQPRRIHPCGTLGTSGEVWLLRGAKLPPALTHVSASRKDPSKTEECQTSEYVKTIQARAVPGLFTCIEDRKRDCVTNNSHTMEIALCVLCILLGGLMETILCNAHLTLDSDSKRCTASLARSGC